jgi:hypothetical protein
MKVDKYLPELKAYSLHCLTSGTSKADFYSKLKDSDQKDCPDCASKKSLYSCNVDPTVVVCEVCGYRNILTEIPVV